MGETLCPPAAGRARRDDAAGYLQALRRLGFAPRLNGTADGPTGSGPALRLSLRRLVSSPPRLAAVCDRLRSLLMLGLPVTLCIDDAGPTASRQLDRLFARLHRATAAPCIDRRRLAICLPATALPLPAFLLVSRAQLGAGPRYLRLTAGELGDRVATPESAAAWQLLYQQRRRQRPLLPVYGSEAKSRCHLLGDEAARVYSGVPGLLLPANAACLVLPLALTRYADCRGRLDESRLVARVAAALGIADRLFDLLYWPDPALRRDALRNRRIVFLVEGIGDLVVLRGETAGSATGLQSLDATLRRLHDALTASSRKLAIARGALPALAGRDPSRRLPPGPARDAWRQRWQAAIAERGLRHRNLLAIPPSALLAHNGQRARDAVGLTPLLRHTDLCAHPGPACGAGWDISEFKDFHCRAWAILERRDETLRVAAGL